MLCFALWYLAPAQTAAQDPSAAAALEQGLAAVALALAAVDAEPVETTAGAQARAAFADEVLRFAPLAEAFLAQPGLTEEDRAYVEGELLTALELRGVRLLELERCDHAAQQLREVLEDPRLQREGLQRLAALTRDRLADANACLAAETQTQHADDALAAGSCDEAAALHAQARQGIAGLALPVLAGRIERVGARLVVCTAAAPTLAGVEQQTLLPTDAPTPRRGTRIAGVSLMTTGGIALATGGVFAGLAADAEADAIEVRNQGRDLAGYQSLRQDAQNRATVANGLLVGGAVIASVGVLLRVLAGSRSDAAETTSSARPNTPPSPPTAVILSLPFAR